MFSTKHRRLTRWRQKNPDKLLGPTAGTATHRRRSLRNLVWLIILAFTSGCASGSGGINAPDQQDKPYLILISIDGFRWDYQDTYDTPTLDRIAASGVRAEAMVPVFPTLTFPNHYSIATGLYPANHGLIGNHFPSRDRGKFYSLRDREAVQDGSWYRGQPIWVAAEKNGMVTAAYYFVGTEAPVDGVAMTYWHQFDASVPGAARVKKALEWLAMPNEKRPHVITLYFEDVDVATHSHGPGSAESIASIKVVDDYLATLLDGIESSPAAGQTYIVVVSDHGQAAYIDGAKPFIIDTVVDLDDFIAIDHGTSAFLYLREPDKERATDARDAINRAWNHGRAMLPADAPADWRVTEGAGFADVILQANPGYAVFTSIDAAGHNVVGNHGWPRNDKNMHGIFLASGPRLPGGVKIPPIENVDVYPLMMEVLDLPITSPIDSDPDSLTKLLRRD